MTGQPFPASGVSRRALLSGGALLTGTAFGGALAGCSAADHGSSPEPPAAAARGTDVVPFHGLHQAGVLTPQQAHAAFLGLDLAPGSERDDVVALLRLLTDDAARLTQGRPPLAALEVMPAGLPARLTVTFGFGPGLFRAVGVPDACPPVVATMPAFSTDRLESRWGQTDLFLQLCCDDPVTLAYARRRLLRDSAGLARLRWVQHGFVNARGTEPDHTTPRNLMGMRDGSANESDPAQAAAVAWCPAGGSAGRPQTAWLGGGSQVVVRRVRLDLEAWDDVEPEAKEIAFGRRLADGAPLTGGTEGQPIDRMARDAKGFFVVAPNAHAARAQARSADERMFRRGYSYADPPLSNGAPDEGQIFVAYQADLAAAFVPVQRRLAEADALNIWATHVGSAAYAVPPGVAEGSFVGAGLLEASA